MLKVIIGKGEKKEIGLMLPQKCVTTGEERGGIRSDFNVSGLR
jgi:hypothetical protein